MANTTEPRVTITPATVNAFVDTFGSADAVIVARVKAVADALNGNKVGEKGSPSQNAVLRTLADAVEKKLGASATVRTGWRFANLGNYARVARAIDTLGLSITSAPLILALYGVQNNARDAFGPFVEKHAGVKAAPAAKLKSVLAESEVIFSDLAKTRALALADKKAEADKAKRNKANKGGDTLTADQITNTGQTPAAFLKSIREALASDTIKWSDKQYRAVADGLVEIADAIVNTLAAKNEANAPEPAAIES